MAPGIPNQGANETVSLVSVVEDAEAKEAALKLARDKEAATKEAAAEEGVSKDAALKEETAKDIFAKEIALKEAAAKDMALKEAAAKDIALKEAAAKDIALKEAAAKDIAKQGPPKEIAIKDDSSPADYALPDIPANVAAAKELAVKVAAAVAAKVPMIQDVVAKEPFEARELAATEGAAKVAAKEEAKERAGKEAAAKLAAAKEAIGKDLPAKDIAAQEAAAKDLAAKVAATAKEPMIRELTAKDIAAKVADTTELAKEAAAKDLAAKEIATKKLENEMAHQRKIELLKSKIQSYPNFPKTGVIFWDIFSALADGPTCTLIQELLLEEIKEHFPHVEAIVGLESRGFLFSFSLAAQLGVKCIPMRKKGKLPGEVLAHDYKLEYGSGTLEIQKNVVTPGLKCLIIDDLIATGGSIKASVELLRSCKADVIGCLAIMESVHLRGRQNIPQEIPIQSLIKYY